MERQTFQRPISRVIVDLFGPLIGAAAFLGVAYALIVGLWDVDAWGRFIGSLGFGFFGVAMASGIPGGIRRGLNRTVLEVGPDGLWTPEMGRLAWSEIAEVRLENVQGFAPEDADHAGDSITIGDTTISTDDFSRREIPTATYRRIGIVPLDPTRTAAERGRLGWRIVGFMAQVSRMANPKSTVQDPSQLAPFGVYAYELATSLDEVVDAIRVYRDVSAA